jgi:excisionase family DNA binding protein
MDELSIKEAAKALGVHADTVRRWISEGKIVAEKRGKGTGQYYIPASAIDSFRPRDIMMQPREIDVTGLTNEIYEQRLAVIKLFELISEKHLTEITIADQTRDISARIAILSPKLDKLTSKLESQVLEEGGSKEIKTIDEVRHREYWWQF